MTSIALRGYEQDVVPGIKASSNDIGGESPYPSSGCASCFIRIQMTGAQFRNLGNVSDQIDPASALGGIPVKVYYAEYIDVGLSRNYAEFFYGGYKREANAAVTERLLEIGERIKKAVKPLCVGPRK